MTNTSGTFAGGKMATFAPETPVVVVNPTHHMKNGVCIDCKDGRGLNQRCQRVSPGPQKQ